MKPQTIKTLYWILTVLFCLAMLADAYGGVTQQKEGQDVLKHLGYPMYLLTISGVAKIIGVIAILQTRFTALKEWAYAGFTINFVFAVWSRAYVGDSIGMIVPPLIMIAYLFIKTENIISIRQNNNIINHWITYVFYKHSIQFKLTIFVLINIVI